ncbi:hypothetical protein AYX13_02783 [Cryptococcus neoformans]|nr:hypothetical protein AYX13_02783 [Cryptococcus neoformans var. grubii]
MSASNQLPEVSSSFISHYPVNTPSTIVTTDMSHFTLQTVQPLSTDQSSPYLTIPNQFGSLSLASPAGSPMDNLHSPTEPTYGPISQLQDQFGIAPTEKSSRTPSGKNNVDDTDPVEKRRAQNRISQRRYRDRRSTELNALRSEKASLEARLRERETIITTLASQRDIAYSERDVAQSRCSWLEGLLGDSGVHSATWQDPRIFPGGKF